MKGFKDSTRMRSGHSFSPKSGFTGSTGKIQNVKGYTRQIVKKATGGAVPMKQEPGGINSYNTSKAVTIGDQGNSAELRTRPLTEFDKDHGGRGPLRPGFAMGGPVGMAGPLRAAVASQTRPPAMRTAIPRGGMNRRPLMRAEGGKVPPKKPEPPKAPPPKPDLVDILRGKTRKQQEEELGLKKGGLVVGPIKKGALHKSMGIPASKGIPTGKLEAAKNSDSALTRKRANFALNARKWNHT